MRLFQNESRFKNFKYENEFDLLEDDDLAEPRYETGKVQLAALSIQSKLSSGLNFPIFPNTKLQSTLRMYVSSSSSVFV